MWTRRVLIPSRLLLLLLSLILVSCSGGDSEAPPSLTAPPGPPQPPASASLIYSTQNTLIKSQTDGSGQVTLADEPAGFDGNVVVSETNVVYRTPQIPAGVNLIDIWAVQTDGTNRHRILHDPTHEHNLLDVINQWVLYTEQPTTFPKSAELASIRFDGSKRSIIGPVIEQNGPHQANYQQQVGARLVFEQINNLFSMLPDGTDRRLLAAIPRGPNGEFTFLGTRGVVGSQVIYSVVDLALNVPNLFAIPVTGGAVTTLVEGPDYKLFDQFFGAVVDARVIYGRCAVLPNFDTGPCDVYSVLSDGSGTVALSTHPDNEVVQGVIGSRVVFRRNNSQGDALFSIHADGTGGEAAILPLSRNTDFVVGIVDARIILQRATGLWSVKADGSELVQLTPDAGSFSTVGPFACFNRGAALWCVPADGSAEPTKVTDHGTFVTGL